MDIQDKIQLGVSKHVNAVNVDTSIKVNLGSTSTLSLEYDVKNVLDITQVFDDERQNVDKYRLHGSIEYLSILNGIPKQYKLKPDFFSQQPASASTKNLLSDFNIYIVKPSTGFTELIANERYVKNYDVIGIIDNIEIVKTAYAVNIFGEQQYSFISNIDIDLTGVRDGLNFPLTEIAIYAEYKPQWNGNGSSEVIRRKTYDSNGNSIVSEFITTPLNIGDTILGNVINYNKNRFLQSDYNVQEYYVDTQYFDGTSKILRWKYNPIIPITLRVFEDDLQIMNSGSTSIEDVSKIPDYATPIDNEGNFVWRNLLDKGFFDPITDVGTNFPFINQKHYVFKKVMIKVVPDLTHSNTASVFSEIAFAPNTKLNTVPNGSIDNIGDLCS